MNLVSDFTASFARFISAFLNYVTHELAVFEAGYCVTKLLKCHAHANTRTSNEYKSNWKAIIFPVEYHRFTVGQSILIYLFVRYERKLLDIFVFSIKPTLSGLLQVPRSGLYKARNVGLYKKNNIRDLYQTKLFHFQFAKMANT